MLKKTIYIVLITLCSLLLYKYINNNIASALPNIKPTNVPVITNTYTLESISTITFPKDTAVTYPTIDKPLSNFDYVFSDLEEQRDITINKYDLLFLASKRLAEIEHGGNKTKILHPFGYLPDKQIEVDDLLRWWGNSKPHVWEIYKYTNFNSWEASLARYADLMEKDLIYTTKQENIKKIKLYLDYHQEKLNEIVSNLKKSDDDKNYLRSLINKIFTELNKKIDFYLLPYDASLLNYSILKVANSKDYGVYDIFLDVSELPVEIAQQAQIVNNNLSFKPKEIPPYIDRNSNLLFSPVIIDSSSSHLSLQLPYKKIEEEMKISKEYDEKKKLYKYYMSVNQDKLNQKIIVKINYKFDNSVSVRLESFFDESRIKSDILMNETLLHSPEAEEFQKILDPTTNKHYIDSRFTLTSDKELPLDNFVQFKVKFIPYYNPEIIIKKVADLPNIQRIVHFKKLKSNLYKIELENFNLYEAKYIGSLFSFGWKINYQTITFSPKIIYFTAYYWPPYLIILLFLLSVSIILLHDNLGNKIYSILKNSILFKTIYYLINLFIKYRFLLFSITLLGIIYDIFFRTAFSDLYLVFFSMLWATTVFIFRAEEKTSFVASLGFLILSPLFSITKQDIAADKLVVWSFMFIPIGVIQSIFIRDRKINVGSFYKQTFYYLLSKILRGIRIVGSTISFSLKNLQRILIRLRLISLANKLLPIYNFFYKLENSLANDTLFYFSRNKTSYILSSISSFIENLFLSVFRSRPKTLKDWFLFLIKGLVICFITIVLIILINYVQGLIKIRERKLLRLSLNPVIKKVEPRILYHSTKGIIYGNGFGWNKEGEKVRLVNQNGQELRTELWTNSKIIFTVPLDWETGPIILQVQKPKIWDGKEIIVKSNQVSIKLIPRTDNFTPDDDAFFEQLKYLDKEALKINGYNN